MNSTAMQGKKSSGGLMILPVSQANGDIHVANPHILSWGKKAFNKNMSTN
ncbi:hypothetical protein VXN68_02050 [Acinetobacter schindleri]|nr:hypothetical protein MOW08_06055 [Acinetobacter schindleri]